MITLRKIDKWLRLSQRGYLGMIAVILALAAVTFGVSFLPGYHDPIMSTLLLTALILFIVAFVLRFRGLGYRLVYLLLPIGLFALGAWGMAGTIAVSITGGGETLNSPFVRFLRGCFYLSCGWFLYIALMGLLPDRLANIAMFSRWTRSKSCEASK